MSVRAESSSSYCPRCTGALIQGLSGEIVCGKCGFVADESTFDTTFVEAKHDRTDTRGVTWESQRSLGFGTVIGTRDSTGATVANADVHRLWDNRIKTRASQRFITAFKSLDIMVKKLALPTVVAEESAALYKKASNLKLPRGRSAVQIVAAAVYTSCRNTNTPRSLKEVAAAAGITKKEAGFAYRLIVRKLDLQVEMMDPIRCVNKIATQAVLPETTKRKAIMILDKAKAMDLTAGKDPMGLAVSALYLIIRTEQEAQTTKVKQIRTSYTTHRSSQSHDKQDCKHCAILDKESLEYKAHRRDPFHNVPGCQECNNLQVTEAEADEVLQEMKKTHSQKDLAMAAGMTEVTVRNTYRDFIGIPGIMTLVLPKEQVLISRIQ